MIKLELSKEIYSEEKIIETMKVYDGYAKMEIKASKDKFILLFKKCKYSEELTVKEFENYLIGLMNS